MFVVYQRCAVNVPACLQCWSLSSAAKMKSPSESGLHGFPSFHSARDSLELSSQRKAHAYNCVAFSRYHKLTRRVLPELLIQVCVRRTSQYTRHKIVHICNSIVQSPRISLRTSVAQSLYTYFRIDLIIVSGRFSAALRSGNSATILLTTGSVSESVCMPPPRTR